MTQPKERVGAAPDFTELVEKHSQFVYNVALRFTNNPADAEEIVQEVFLAAYKALPAFRGQSAVSTWLYRITVNACLMRTRKEKRSKYLSATAVEDLVIPDWSANPEKAALNSALGEAINQGLSRLPPDLRTAVILRDAQGLSGEEAAAALDIPVPTLKTRLHRGRILLRKFLEPYAAKP